MARQGDGSEESTVGVVRIRARPAVGLSDGMKQDVGIGLKGAVEAVEVVAGE